MEIITIGPVYIGDGQKEQLQGWVEHWQKLTQRSKKTQIVEFGVAMTMCACTHKGPRQTCTDNGSHIRSTQPNCIPPLATFNQSSIYMASKNHPGEADQSTLASGGSEHPQLFSVTINWGKKINFSLCVNVHVEFFLRWSQFDLLRLVSKLIDILGKF